MLLLQHCKKIYYVEGIETLYLDAQIEEKNPSKSKKNSYMQTKYFGLCLADATLNHY